MVVLSGAPSGASFKVTRVNLGKEVGKRLSDMGFTEGREGAVVRRAFFGGPIQVRILGYDVLIRRFEADGIEVEPVGDWSAVRDSRKLRGCLPPQAVKELAKGPDGEQGTALGE